MKRHKAQLHFRRIESGDSEDFTRFATLTKAVFTMEPRPAWPAAAFFDDEHRCVAGLQHRILVLSCDGAPCPVAAIRNVAVAPDWRGLGLMTDLMADTLRWSEDQAAVTLLYAETPALYARYGFAPLAQDAFEAEAPEPVGPANARLFDGGIETALLARLLAERAPASRRCGVVDDGGMADHKIANGAWSLAYDAELDALFVHGWEGDTLVLADIVTAQVPSAARILGALGVSPKRLRTLFSPDCLGWSGIPVPEDAGLMARGTVPLAMREPFILPPTFEF